MKNFYIIILAVLVTGAFSVFAITPKNPELKYTDKISSKATTAGNFNKLLESGSAEELNGIVLGDSKEKVAEVLKVKPTKESDVSSSIEFDYYQHYELGNGKKYDIYYKNGAVAGVTAFA